jgi:outer membrane receptor protein involved in Fe transport
MKSPLLKSTLLALLMIFSLSAFAQFEKATISGTVTDTTGAAVVGAEVKATSVNTGTVRTATTNDSGLFTLTNMAPDTYEVTASHAGFAEFKQSLTVSPGGHSTIDAKLEVRATGETVEVVAGGSTQVETQTSSISQTVSTYQVSQLPSLTRDPYDFVQTMGNVNQDSASGSGGSDQIVRGAGVSINGQRSASTDALLDGAENVDLYTTKVGQSVPLDSVAEFSVTSNNFSAEYGRASGGVINVVTKSGTNQLHGGAYEFNRVSKLTSNDYDDNARGIAKAKYTRNQFGFSIGGPAIKNKLFFFSNLEWTRVRSAANQLLVIPDPAFIAASVPATQAYFAGFSARPGLKVTQVFPASTAPATVNSSAMYTSYTTANGGNNPLFDLVNYQSPGDSGGGGPQNTLNMVHKVDFTMNDKTSMYVRYANFNLKEIAGFVNNSPYKGFDTGQTELNQNLLYSLTHVWSQSVVTETKVNVNRLTLEQALASQPVQPTIYFNTTTAANISGNLICMPGYSCTTPGNSIPFGGPQNVIQFGQSLSWNHGKHDVRVGGAYIYTRDNRTFGAYENAVQGLEAGGSQGGLAWGADNLMNADAGWFQVVINPQGQFPCFRDNAHNLIVTPACLVTLPTNQPSFARSNRYKDGSFYGQDTWKVSPRLTLNLGLRWEYYGVQHNKDPKIESNFVLGTGSTIQQRIASGKVYTVGATPNSPASPIGGLWTPSKKNFAPRVGFALDVFGDGKTSLRGGYGIAYERNFGNVTFNVIQNPPSQFNSIFQSAVAPGQLGAQALSSSNLGPFAGSGIQVPLPPPSLRYVRQDIPTSYSQSWNLSLQREVMKNSILAVEYTGAHTIHDYSIENLNQQGFGIVYLGADLLDPMCTSEAPGNAENCKADRLNRQYGNMNTRGFGGYSHYNALNTRFQSTNLFRQGLDLTVNYTYSHSLDNLSSAFSETPQTENLGLLDPFQPALDYGSADFDARHRVAISAVWAVPYAKNTHGFVKQVVDGWEFAPIVTARSGNPFTVFDSSFGKGGDTAFARYQLPAGATVKFTGNSNNVPASNELNYNNFAGANTFQYLQVQGFENPDGTPATYLDPFGISGELPTCDTTTNGAGNIVSTGKNCKWPANMTHRNAFRGPGAYNINLAVRKQFSVTERVKLQFSTEFYNLLNHSNYYVQSGGTNDVGNFGPPADPITGNPIPGFFNFQVIGKRGVVPAAGVPNERRFIQMALRLSF